MNPCIGVMDLQKVIRKQILRANSRDLYMMLKTPKNAHWGWKTAPNICWMSQTADLMLDFCKVAPNALLPGAKLRSAILKLHEEKKMNYSNLGDSDWVDQCDQRIRVILSQYRAIKSKQSAYLAAMRKATEQEKASVDAVLASICLGDEGDGEEEEEGNAVAISAPEDKSSCLALVPYNSTSSSSSSTPNVFKRILARTDSSPAKNKAFSPEKFVAKASPKKLQRTHTPMFVGGDDSSTEDKLHQQKKVKGRKQKNKPKMDYGLCPEDEAFVEQALGSEVSRAKPVRQKKKRGRKKPEENEGVDKVGKQKPGPKKKPAAAKAKGKPAAKSLKSSFKHRKTSSAYHKTKNLRLKMGDSPNTAKRHAQSASRGVASQIDSGILEED